MAKINKQSVKKTGRERKETLVAELTDKLDTSNGLVFTDYKGITHQQLEALRRELKSVDASLLIAKNSLMKLSLGKSKNFSDYKDNEELNGPAATLFIGKDSIEPLKKLQKSIKDTGLPVIKFGVLEGQLLDEAGVLKLASLPSKEVLIAQFVGMLNSPIQRFVSGLNAIPQKFVMTLDAVAKAKPADAPSTPEPSTPSTDAKPTAPASDEAPSSEDSNAQDEAEASEATDSNAKDTEEVKDESVNKDSEDSKEEPKEEKTETEEKGGEDK